MATDWPVWVLGIFGAGTIGAMVKDTVKDIVARRVPNVETEADRVVKREAEADTTATAFREELRGEIGKLREMHAECEKARKADHAECQASRAQDREEVAELRGRVAFFQSALDNLTPGAPQSNGKATSRKKTKAC